jgi:hypothetical protein
MKAQLMRARLTVLWAGSFAVALLGTLYLRWWVGIGADNFTAAIELVSTQYAPYLGAVIGFYFATKAQTQTTSTNPVIPHRLALVMSSLWNITFVGLLARACLQLTTIEEALNDISTVIPKLAWIVAPSIGYFFGKSPGVSK